MGGLPPETVTLTEKLWRAEFLPYYLDARGASEEARDQVLHLLGVPSAERDRIFEGGKAAIKRAGTAAPGTLGEAQLSFVLERQRCVILTKAAWKMFPFAVTTGIDLVGLRLNDWQISLTELKTWPSIRYPSDLQQAFEEVCKQLRLERCDERFHSDEDDAAYVSVCAELQKRIRNGMLPDEVSRQLNESGVQRPVRDRYHRLGAVIDESSLTASEVTAYPDSRDGHPWELMLMKVERLSDLLAELGGAEQEWKRQMSKAPYV